MMHVLRIRKGMGENTPNFQNNNHKEILKPAVKDENLKIFNNVSKPEGYDEVKYDRHEESNLP